MSNPATSTETHGFRRRTVVLRRPPDDMIDDPATVDLERAAELVNSGVLTAEISAANGNDPDLEV